MKLVSLLFRYPDISVVFWVCQVPGKGGRSNKEIAQEEKTCYMYGYDYETFFALDLYSQTYTLIVFFVSVSLTLLFPLLNQCTLSCPTFVLNYKKGETTKVD